MKLFRDCTEQARPLLLPLQAEFDRSRLRLARARAKLFTRVSHPQYLTDGESYAVDLGGPRFEALFNESIVATGPLQVIGTYFPAGETWVWAAANPSIRPDAKREIADWIEGVDLLAGLRTCVKFAAADDFCEQLAQWIATEAGWLAAYPAPLNETIVYLALKLSLHPDHSVEPADNVWCSYCGRFPGLVDRLIVAAPDVAICDRCVAQLETVAEERRRAPRSDAGRSDLPPCLLCGGLVGRLFTEVAAVCQGCIRSAVDLLAEC